MSQIFDKHAFDFLKANGFDLIPLCQWDRVDTDAKTGAPVPRGKTPRDNDWLRQTYTERQIQKGIQSGGNLGVRISADLVVVDIDPRHPSANGRTADQILADMEMEFGNLRASTLVRTGGGGLHVYLRKPETVRVRNSVEAFGGCVEFKSWGRQVLAPGCKHPPAPHGTGAPYQLLHAVAPQPIDPALLELIRKPEPKPREFAPGEGASIERLTAAFAQLDPIRYRDYEVWRNLLFATHYATGGSPEGLALFKQWSAGDPEYAGGTGGSIDLFWHYASDQRDDSITEATIFYLVDQGGGVIPADVEAMRGALSDLPEETVAPVEPGSAALPAPEQKKAAVYRRDRKGFIDHKFAENLAIGMRELDIGVRTDTFTGRRWLVDSRGFLRKHFGLDNGSELTDRSTLLLGLAVTREIRYWTGEPSKDNTYRAMAVVEQQFHSLRDYLDALQWDGVERLDTWLIGSSDLPDSDYTRGVSRLWLYAAVGRAYCPGVKFDAMVVLEGPQGGGKSSLVRWLGGQWAAEGLPDFRSSADKDVVGGMIGRWLVEIEEMSAMRKADVESLKAFLSRQEDRVRPPYGREVLTYPRQCVFVGTTNLDAYMRDLTGNRRYLPLDIGRVRFDALPARDQLWAEAVAAWRAAPSPGGIALPEHLWADAAREQEERRVTDTWEEQLAEFLDKQATSEITTITIFEDCFRIQMQKVTPFEQSRVAQLMQKFGWKRTNKIRSGLRFVRGYRRDGAELE